ncbi:MAG TPA: BTAD domain-containing putative transcriptional regulator [Gaiellaceae bacterium]|nr:BTAD domain-containing putative transcriptional regulator [Gaiellaceae bacterium]
MLGPVEARLDGAPLALGGPKLRALLALLALRAGEAVPRETLVDGVWGATPPSTINAVLNVYLSRIRKLLRSAGADAELVTRPHGYLLRIERERIDAVRFELLAREAQGALAAGDAPRAAAGLRDALSLWRGPPLADVADAPFAALELPRLGELRLAALEDRIEADLRLGRHAAVLPDLEALVVEQPLRERPRAQLMLALYRSGRQSEALRVYRDARVRLAEELGLDPGPELRELERRILVQDPALAPPRAPGPPGYRRPTRLPLAFAAAALAVAAVSSALVSFGGAEPRAPLAQPAFGPEEGRAHRADEVAVLQPETRKVVARLPVGTSPVLLREGDGSVWVADRDDLTLTQIDLESRRVVKTIGVGFRPGDLAASDGAVWALDADRGVLARLGRGAVWDRFEHPDFAGAERIALADGSVWLTGGGRLLHVDAATGRVVHRADVRVPVDGVAVTGSGVWAVSGPASTLLELDPSSAAIRDRIPLAAGHDPRLRHRVAVAFDGELLWILNGSTRVLTAFDPARRSVASTFTLPPGEGPFRLAAGDGAAWVADESVGTVTRVDADDETVSSLAVASNATPTDVAVAGGLLWIALDASGRR